MRNAPITIKDIAKELNVSISTVSRALSDNPLVKASTRKAVQELANKYNYTPNFTALSLKNNKTNTIGIIIPQLVHEFFASVIRGIEDVAYSQKYNVMICSSHESYEREVLDAKALINGRVDGLIACMSRNTKEYQHFIEFSDRGIPIVFFDCICEAIDSHKILIDDFDAGYRATKHLIEQSCENIAYLGGPISLQINQDRYAGYIKALSEAGLNPDDQWIIHCNTGSFEDGLSASLELTLHDKIDGLFAGTDMLALSAIKNFKAKGRKIPEDIAVIGFSNWTISSLYEPSISTIDQPGYEMGKKAAELLLKDIKSPYVIKPETHILQTNIIVRDSSSR
jgi:LacI family transcriptional regulator